MERFPGPVVGWGGAPACMLQLRRGVCQKRVSTMISFVEYFFPTGLFACASRPLVDAALDLMTTCTNRQNPGQKARKDSIAPVRTRAIAANGMDEKYS